jgi:hypothetical protein
VASQRQSSMSQRRVVVRERTPIDGRMGGTRDVSTTYEADSSGNRQRRSRIQANPRLSGYNPATLGAKSTDSAGALEAEFLIAIVLLVLLMFSNSSSSYSSKIMSFMKRGTLVCILFFVLALVSSAGPNVAKACKAFGALIIVAILITAPMGTVFTDLDNVIKNDWIGTSETEGGSSASSADSGTESGTSSAAGNDLNTLQQILNDLNPGAKIGSTVGQSLGTAIKNYISQLPGAIKDFPSNILKEFGL